MIKKIIIALCVALVIFAVGYNAYQSKKFTATGKAKVYAFFPLTGADGLYGKAMQVAIDSYMKTKNFDFEIVYIDSQADPAYAVSAFHQKTLNEKNPLVLAAFSTVASAMASVVEQKNGFLFAVSALGTVSKSKAYQLVTRNAFDVVNVLVPYIKKNFKNIAIVYVEGAYGFSEVQILENGLKGSGVDIVEKVPLMMPQRDVRLEVLKAIKHNTDAIVVLGAPTIAYINVFKELKAQEYKGQIISNSAITSPHILQAIGPLATEGIIASAMQTATDVKQSNKVENLKQQIAQKGMKFYFIMIEAIEAIDLIQYTFENELPFTQETYQKIGVWHGDFADVVFKDGGQCSVPSYVLIQLQDGKIIPVEE